MVPNVPTLYEWLGGAEPLQALIERFYQKVPDDPLLARSSPACRPSTSSTSH